MWKRSGLLSAGAVTVARLVTTTWAGERISTREAAGLLKAEVPEARLYQEGSRTTRG